MRIINPHVAALDTPAIPMALAWAESYREDYGPLIDLSQAVPNYPPHSELLRTLAMKAASVDMTGYGEIEGEPELRSVYAALVSEQYESSIEAGMIHVTSGCNQAFMATLITLAKAGDQILVTDPCYFNHEATAKILGLNIDYIPCLATDSFLPTVESIESRLSDTTRVVALVSPNNPTGAVYPAELLDSILNLCNRRGVWLVLDETYRDFLPPEKLPCHRLFNNAAWQQTFVQLYSFSKAFCIPGHRLGAITASEGIVSNVAKVMDNLQICAPRAAQHSVAELLLELKSWRGNNADEIALRATAFTDVMTQFPQWKIVSIGAYFAYVRHPYTAMTSSLVAQRMAGEFGILPLPGSFFGNDQDDYLRVAFANVEVPVIHRLAERLRTMEKQW